MIGWVNKIGMSLKTFLNESLEILQNVTNVFKLMFPGFA